MLSSKDEDERNNRIRMINDIFTRMAIIYQKTWTSRFNDKEFLRHTKNEWYRSLKGYDYNIASAAIEKCKLYHPAFPPQLGEFMAICKELTQSLSTDQPKTGEIKMTAREVLPETEDVINKIYEMLGKKRTLLAENKAQG